MKDEAEITPLPQAGGAGGGQERKFKSRNTSRARDLRNEATPAERHLWQYLRAGQLGAKFSRQMPVGPYFADFLCRSAKLIVELDGYSHNLTIKQDKQRDRHLQDMGYRVIRFTNEDALENTEGVIFAISEALRRAHP